MKQVTHIDCAAEWQSTNDWDSHRPLLWLAVNLAQVNKVWEFGCGYGSTKLLHNYCIEQGISFGSVDTNKDWAKKFECTNHVHSYDLIGKIGEAILFVDCAPGEIRKLIIDKYKDDAKVIIVHDSEKTSNYVYGMADILSTFKYRIDYCPEGKPWTTAVSNFVNIEEWI